MKYITLKNGMQVPQLALGCMRIADKDQEKVNALIAAALEEGVSFKENGCVDMKEYQWDC